MECFGFFFIFFHISLICTYEATASLDCKSLLAQTLQHALYKCMLCKLDRWAKTCSFHLVSCPHYCHLANILPHFAFFGCCVSKMFPMCSSFLFLVSFVVFLSFSF